MSTSINITHKTPWFLLPWTGLCQRATTVVLGLLWAGLMHAQDLHFSQYMNVPLLTNPANAGFNPDYDYRLGVNYRSQWVNLPVPYKTVSAWADWQILRNKLQNGWLGVGGVLLRDVAGAGNLTSTKVYANIAYHQELGEGSLLSAGFNVGMATKSIDVTKFNWESQWNGKFFDANAPIGEPIAFRQISYPDVQLGLNYAYFGRGNFYFNTGASIMHVNRPRESFFSADVSDNKVPMRYTAFANASFKLNDQWILNPSAYYSNQSRASEAVGGLTAQYNLSGDGNVQLLGGVYYRWGDAAVALVGLEWNNLRLSFTYDATTSNLRNFNGATGATEFALLKFGEYTGSGPRNTRCPSFK
ncbi:MAG: type IX secretion system membrane protein PorP/SprF [Bacteroidetes bacterium]|nr:MAG: type IX secretion system membrane protein PorP/SprF [Bacteroidota bacterium]